MSDVRGVESALPEGLRGESSGARATLVPPSWQPIRRRLLGHRLAVAASFALFVLCSFAIFAEVIAPYGSQQRHLEYAYAPPQSVHFDLQRGVHTYALSRYVDPVTFRKQYIELVGQPLALRLFPMGEPYRLWGLIPMRRRLFGVVGAAGTATGSSVASLPEPTFFVLGADRQGRDVFSRIVYGARVSLSVALIASFFSFVLGACIGGVSGYVGGRTDRLIQRGIEVIQTFPQLPLWLALAAALPGDWTALGVCLSIALLLSLLSWTALARAVRGKILSLREKEHVVAARLLGAGQARILFGHVWPRLGSHLLLVLSLSVPGLILGETALSFLGLGLRPPIVSWGVMLQDCLDVKAMRLYPWLLSPVVFVCTLLLCCNVLADGVRDAADPYN